MQKVLSDLVQSEQGETPVEYGLFLSLAVLASAALMFIRATTNRLCRDSLRLSRKRE